MVWLIDERRLALFPAGTIVRDPQHREILTRREQGLSLRRASEFRPWWMRLCSSDNHYTTAQLYVWNVKTPLLWKSFKHYFVLFGHKFSLLIQRYVQFWFFRKTFFSNMYLKQERYFSCYILLTGQISLSDSFTSWDIGQYVYCNYSFPNLWRRKI